MQSTYAQWLRYGAYTILTLLVVVGGYYFVYFQQHTEQLAEDRLDLLRESSDYFTEELGRVKRNIENTLNDSAKVSDPSKLRSALDEITDLTRLQQDRPRPYWEKDGECHERVGQDSVQNLRLRTVFERSVPQPVLRFGVSGTPSSDGAGDTEPPFCGLGKTSLESLLVPLLPQRETAFDEVVLARQNGNVLASSGTGVISIERLPVREEGALVSGGREDTSASPGLYSKIFTMEAGGASYRVFLHPFTVPVDITYGDNSTTGQEETLYLAGVKQEQAFRAEARKLPPMLLAILLGIVALALLAFPFLEVWLIGPTESFRPHDVFEVAVGVVIASSIATVVGLSFFSVHQLEDRQFDQLKRFSEALRTTLETEAKAANRQLTHLTRLVRQCDTLCRRQSKIWDDTIRVDRPEDSLRVVSSDSLHYPHLEMASWIDKEQKQVAKWSVEDQITPLISLSDRGYVRAHEEALGTPWSSSQHSEVWEYQKDDSTETEWVLESIRSKNTGEVFAQISQSIDSEIVVEGEPSHTDATPSSKTDTAVVAAATLPLLSVIEPVLPSGFRFAVIDEEGKVLFHSDTRRNLRENMFDTIIGGEHLRDAVLARQTDRATAQYREDTYQFYAHPVSNSPWTLLVFGELEPLRALHGQVLAVGIVLYVGYLLLLLGVLLVWMACSDIDRFSLRGLFYALWPTPQKNESYRTLFWGEVVVFLIGIGGLLLAFGGGFSWPIVGVPVLAAVSLLLFCHYGNGGGPFLNNVWGPERRGSGSHLFFSGFPWRHHYVASLLLLVLNIGVVPVLVSYTVRYDESAELLTKKNQLVFAQRLQERGEMWDDHYRRIALRRPVRDTLDQHLYPEAGFWVPRDIPTSDSVTAGPPWDVHTVSGRLEVEVDSTSDEREADGHQPLFRALRSTQFIDQTSLWGFNLHLLSDTASSDGLWAWTRNDTTLTLHPSASYRAGGLQVGQGSTDRLSLQITSFVPTLAVLFWQDAWTAAFGILIFGGLLLGLLWWVLGKLYDQIFFLDLVSVLNPSGAQSSAMGELDGPDRVLHLRGDPDGTAIDASSLRDDEQEQALIEQAREADSPVQIENFHAGLDEAELVERKRAVLEALLEMDKDVRVYSDVDPMPYLIDRFSEEDGSVPTTINLEAWATVLRPFRTEFFPPLVNEAEASDDESVEEPPRAVVARECRVDPYLNDRVGDVTRAVLATRLGASPPEEQVVEQVKYHARSHYQHLWMTCTDEEKVILHRLSTDGFVSPHSRSVVKQLLRRRLVVMEPELRPMNESFRRFVAGLDSPVIARYEQKASSTAWSRVRVPLLLGFALVLGFVVLTQPDLIKEWMGTFAPALAAGIPALLNVASGVFGGSAGMQGVGAP